MSWWQLWAALRVPLKMARPYLPCMMFLVALVAARPVGAQETPTAAAPAPAVPTPAETVPAPSPAPAAGAAGDEAAPEADEEEYEAVPLGDLFELGQHLFESFAPEEIKERYRYPTREEWDDFAVRLDRALQSHSLSDLAEMEPEARAALEALRALPVYEDYADWLEERLNDITIAQQAQVPAPVPSPTPDAGSAAPATAEPQVPGATAPPSEATAASPVPLYDLWLERMRQRPAPVRAAHLVPRLKPVFVEAELPAALVWMAETESSFNPAARSPVGARGLFQLMPGTAKDLGLKLSPFDERLDPVKSARSAARYLHRLHTRFRDWPLALAAYNAGPGRVGRLLKERQATTFAEIADVLPSETRLYVPKVLATLAVREGVNLNRAAGTQPVAALINGGIPDL